VGEGEKTTETPGTSILTGNRRKVSRITASLLKKGERA